jgi:uncharacterized Tic20 family protein
MTESNVSPPPAPAATTPAAPPVGYEAPAAGMDIVPPANKDEQNMGLLMFILGIFTGFLGPLILWLVKKDDSRYINAQGKEILNWQITVVLAFICCFILAFVIIGFFLIPVVAITNLVFMIIGAVTASKGQFYRYPFALRLLK